MATQLAWTATRDALAATVENAIDIERSSAQTLVNALTSVGTQYDAGWNDEVAAAKDAGDALFTVAYGDWLARYSARGAEIDAVAQWAESLQHAANVLTSPNPYVQLIDGERVLLSPTTEIPFLDDEPEATAFVLIDGEFAIRAREPGTFGNTVRIQISDSSSPELFKLTATLGSFVETFEPVRAGGGPHTGGSLLIGEVEWSSLSPSRPANQEVFLAGGRGNYRSAVTARIERAAKLPVLTDAERALVESHVELASTIDADKPVPRYGGAFASRRPGGKLPNVIVRGVVKFGAQTFLPSVYELETELTLLLEEAETWLAAHQ